MIDWLTFIAPLEHRAGPGGPFYAGEVMATVPDPELGERLDWSVWKRKAVVGSHSSVVQVQSTGPFEIVYIDPKDDPRGAAKPKEKEKKE